MTKPGLAVLRDVSFVTAIALLTFQGWRRHVGDYYRVPSGSMEPLLHGDPHTGDVVFVRSLGAAADCQRHDLVVVRHPDDREGLLVKRIGARGDDPDSSFIELLEGDVWLGASADPSQLRREVKDPLAARDMRVPWARWPAAGHGVDGLDLTAASHRAGRLALPPLEGGVEEVRRMCKARADQTDRGAPPRGAIGSARQVDASHLGPDGVRRPEGADVGVFDCGLELALANAPDTVVAALESSRELVTFLWRPKTGSLELWRDGESVRSKALPPVAGAHRVELGLLDDRYFFVVDGRVDSTECLAREAAWNQRDPALPRGPRSHLWVGVVGGEPADIAELTVFRDVFYYRDAIPGVPGHPRAWPREVRPGHWFLLGDNAFDSRDSRTFGDQPLSAFVGRPWFVLGPRSRQRWLVR